MRPSSASFSISLISTILTIKIETRKIATLTTPTTRNPQQLLPFDVPPMPPLTPLSIQILVALADAPLHGYGIVQEIERIEGRPLQSSTGTLYLAIQRLGRDGLIEEDVAPRPDEDQRRRYYRLTDLGRDTAVAEMRRLAGLLDAARRKHLVAPSPTDRWVTSPSGSGEG
jgi:DNA-binding PadR family transcriptional regulator